MNDQIILAQLNQLPDNLKNEVMDFIEFLMSKNQNALTTKNRPKFGSAKGKYKMSVDFDEPLDDFKEYM